MKESDIRKYAALMSELDLTGLEITEGDQKVRLERVVSQPAPAPYTGTPVEQPQPAETAEETGIVTVRSPLVGLFYTAPAENADPYVSIGDSVQKGQTLCIIEAMKLMNEITAEEDGEICEICATNGQMVEFGTALFRIRR